MTVPILTNPVFVGGAPRSGTTLLRAILNAADGLHCGPELRVIPALCALSSQIRHMTLPLLSRQAGLTEADFNAAFAEAISGFLSGITECHPDTRIAEKTPANVLHFKELRRLFPDARLINIIRDGRDVVASLLNCDWKDAKTGAPMDIVTNPSAAAQLWKASIQAAEEMQTDSRFLTLRYETLATRPRDTLATLFAFVEEQVDLDRFDHTASFHITEGEHETSALRVAQPIDARSIGRWKSSLTKDQQIQVMNEIGPELEQLGYD